MVSPQRRSMMRCLTMVIDTGTAATASQMAKDVATFLSWAAEPEHDERKKYGIKAVIIFSALTLISLYVKRFKWTVIKNRKIRTFSLFWSAGVSVTNESLHHRIQPPRRQNSLEVGTLFVAVVVNKEGLITYIWMLLGNLF